MTSHMGRVGVAALGAACWYTLALATGWRAAFVAVVLLLGAAVVELCATVIELVVTRPRR